MDHYYIKQLLGLKDSDEYAKIIVVSDSEGNKTKHLSLNEESIPQIVDWLNMELNKITRGKIHEQDK